MSKWRVSKNRDQVYFVVPWEARHPLGFTYHFSSWDAAMSYVGMRVMTSQLANTCAEAQTGRESNE